MNHRIIIIDKVKKLLYCLDMQLLLSPSLVIYNISSLRKFGLILCSCTIHLGYESVTTFTAITVVRMVDISLVPRPKEEEEEEKGPGFSRLRMRLIIDLTTC